MIPLRLSVMMFIQFFMWGAWYVTAYLFLGKIGFGGTEISWTYSVGPIAGMISPFFVGMIADRFFSTERVLGVMHLLGAGAMYLAIQQMVPMYDATQQVATIEKSISEMDAVQQADEIKQANNEIKKLQSGMPSPTTVNLLFFVHMLCYFPTLALTNSLALNTMTDPEKQFPLIRVFGTIGWIVAGILVSLQDWDSSVNIFYIAVFGGAVIGLYSFTLPHTPPPSKGKDISVREILGLDALVLLKQKPFAIFMASSFLVCIPLAFYYQMASKYVDQTGQANVAFKMSFGQMSEIFFMLVMPLFFKRLGVKWMLFVGMLAWVVRYGLFSMAAANGVGWMVITGITLHGICYDFFFVTGQIYTDKVAPTAIRGQAQGMLVLFTLGLGMLIGAQCAGFVEESFVSEDAESLNKQAKAVQLQITDKEKEVTEILGLTESPKIVRWVRFVFPPKVSESDEQRMGTLNEEIADLRKERSNILLQTANWKVIWGIPAAFAAIIMLAFALVFYPGEVGASDEGSH